MFKYACAGSSRAENTTSTKNLQRFYRGTILTAVTGAYLNILSLATDTSFPEQKKKQRKAHERRNTIFRVSVHAYLEGFRPISGAMSSKLFPDCNFSSSDEEFVSRFVTTRLELLWGFGGDFFWGFGWGFYGALDGVFPPLRTWLISNLLSKCVRCASGETSSFIVFQVPVNWSSSA